MTVNLTSTRTDALGNDSTPNYSYGFKIFDQSELTVVVRNTTTLVETTLTLTTDYTVTGVGETNGGQISLVSNGGAWLSGTGNLNTGYSISILRNRSFTQQSNFRDQSDFFPETHEDQFDRQVMNDQQLKEASDRSIKLPASTNPTTFNTALPPDAVAPNRVIAFNSAGDGMQRGPTIGDVEAAAGNATAAAASATAAAASQTAAATSETNAAASAIVAQNAANSSLWSDVVDRDFLSSGGTITVVAADNGKFFNLDTSLNSITVVLPEISTLDPATPFRIAIKKTDTSGNSVLVNVGGGSDTIAGEASDTIDGAESGCVYVADADAAPDNWASACFGTQTGNKVVDSFTGDGVQTAYTLSIAPGSENNVQAFFSGVYQNKSTFSLSGSVVTFLTAPPSGVEIEFVIGTIASLGVPADRTVSPIKTVNSVRTATSATSIGVNERTVFCNTDAGGFTVTLPNASSVSGQKFRVVNISSSNLLTIDTVSSQQINSSYYTAQTSITVPAGYAEYSFVSTGTGWHLSDTRPASYDDILGSFLQQTSSTSFVDLLTGGGGSTPAGGTINCRGGVPVEVGLKPGSSTGTLFVPAGVDIEISALRNTTQFAVCRLSEGSFPPSIVSFIDRNVPVGENVYSMQWRIRTGSGTTQLVGFISYAKEIY